MTGEGGERERERGKREHFECRLERAGREKGDSKRERGSGGGR